MKRDKERNGTTSTVFTAVMYSYNVAVLEKTVQY